MRNLTQPELGSQNYTRQTRRYGEQEQPALQNFKFVHTPGPSELDRVLRPPERVSSQPPRADIDDTRDEINDLIVGGVQ